MTGSRCLRLIRRQRGVSYGLSFVLVLPLYLTVVLALVEIGFLMLARIGVQTAAHATARAAVVWATAEPKDLRDVRITQAAWQALAPYAGGRDTELAAAGPVPAKADEFAKDWAKAVRSYAAPAAATDPPRSRPYQRSKEPPPEEFLARKYRHAAARTTVEWKKEGDAPRADITATVTYRAPLYLPFVSRFLATGGRNEVPLEATVTLPAEGPQTDDGTLGIEYHSAVRSK